MDKFIKTNNLDYEFDFVVNNSKLNSKQTKINNNKKKDKEEKYNSKHVRKVVNFIK